VWAGVIAGPGSKMIEMAMLAPTGQSPWVPPRMMATIILGSDVLPPLATFDMGAMAAAMGVHLPLSIVYGLIFAAFAARLSLWPALMAGTVYGLLIYAVNFRGMTSLFPWFAEARGVDSILGHAVFGVILAGAYEWLSC
jgi:uncharacterized membrane protein YagU involved in acid resistance